MRTRPLLVVLLALAVAGCGGASGDDAAAVAEDWLTAVRDADGAAACELMLPSARAGLLDKYLKGQRDTSCEAVVKGYRARLTDEKLDAILDGGLEFDGEIEKDRIGVFPAVEKYQFEVILMQREDDEWKVASPAIDPDHQ